MIAEGLADRERDGPADLFERLAGWRLSGPAPLVRRTMTVDGEQAVAIELGPLAEPGGPAAEARVDGASLTVVLLADEPLGAGRRLRLTFDGVGETWVAVAEGQRWWPGNEGRAWQCRSSDRTRAQDAAAERDLRAPMPGSIVAVNTCEGAVVARGDVLLVMESMKMELQITAPADGTVAALHVAEGDQVALDTLLASVAPAHLEGVAA